VTLPSRDEVDHSPGRPQHWSTVDVDVRDWIGRVVDRLGQLDSLLAVFLHGSLATGSFFRPKSDVDLVAVVDDSLHPETRRAVAVDLLDAFDHRPIVGGVEVSIVLRRSLDPFVHPLPYEFHFSESWADDIRRGGSGPSGSDIDLAAQCTMLRQRGIALAGPPPRSIVGEVPHNAYVAAAMDDARWIVDGGILESPFYGVLNLCRCLQLMLDTPDEPASKHEGARWALDNLPVIYRPIVTAAVECHRSDALVPSDLRRVHGHRWDAHPLRELASYAREVLHL
jgi:streptomycin 3"-adenylyltransferase